MVIKTSAADRPSPLQAPITCSGLGLLVDLASTTLFGEAVTYWATALLSYVLCPILMEYEASGDFTMAARLKTSLRRNAVFYSLYGLIMALLLIALIARGEVQGDLQSWCIAASNAWGLLLLTVLMGFGLVAVPRHFWSLAKPAVLLQDLYRNAVLKDETRLSRLFELQDAIAQARAELATHQPDETNLALQSLQRAAFATLSQMTDRCECLHMELSGTRISMREKSDIEGREIFLSCMHNKLLYNAIYIM